MTPLLWWILGGVVTAGAVAVAVSGDDAPAKKPGGGKLGGGFSADDFSDSSITEGELAEAAAHGDEDAKNELARRQNIKRARDWCSVVDASDYCEDLAKAGNTIGFALASLYNRDLASDANTPEQKARLTRAVKRIVDLGYPPTGFTSLQEFGAEDQAATIEEDISSIEAGPTYDAPFMGRISIAQMLSLAGKAAVDTAGHDGETTTRLNAAFNRLAGRRAVYGVTFVERPITLMDSVPTAGNLDTEHPVLAYYALAASGRYGLPISQTYDVVARSAAGFNDRHGITSRSDALSTDTRIAGYAASVCGPAILAEVWFALMKEAHDKTITDVTVSAEAHPRISF